MTLSLKLSAFILCYNQAHLLRRQLQAFVNQDYQPLEIILVDDGSSDGTYDLMMEFARNYSTVKVIRHERNQGVIAGFNTAVQAASGDFLYGGSADDEVQPGFFSTLMAVAADYPDCGVVFCDALWERHGEIFPSPFGLSKHPTFFSPDQCVAFYRSRQVRWIPGHTTVWNLAHFKAVGRIREELGGLCDFLPAWALVFRHGAGYVPRTLALAVISDGQWSRKTSFRRATAATTYREMVKALASDEFVDIRQKLIKSRVLTAYPYFPALMRSGHVWTWLSPQDGLISGAKWLTSEILHRLRLFQLIQKLRKPMEWRNANRGRNTLYMNT